MCSRSHGECGFLSPRQRSDNALRVPAAALGPRPDAAALPAYIHVLRYTPDFKSTLHCLMLPRFSCTTAASQDWPQYRSPGTRIRLAAFDGIDSLKAQLSADAHWMAALVYTAAIRLTSVTVGNGRRLAGEQSPCTAGLLCHQP